MAYNISFMDNTTDMVDIVQGINTASNNMLSIFILAFVYIYVFVATMDQGTSTAMITSGISSVVVGSLLMFMALITWQILLIPVLLTVAAVFVKAFGG